MAKNSSTSHIILTSSLGNMFAQVVILGSIFVMTPILLRYLGQENYGLWAVALSVQAFGGLMNDGFWGAIIRYIAKFYAEDDLESGKKLIGSFMWLYIAAGLLVMAVLMIFAQFLPNWLAMSEAKRPLATQLFMITALTQGLTLPAMVPRAVLHGLKQFKLLNIIDVFMVIFTALVSWLFLAQGFGILAIAWGYLAGVVIMFVSFQIAVYTLEPKLVAHFGRFDWSMTKLTFNYSWPLFVQDLSHRLQTKTDEFTLGIFAALAVVTPYNIARRLSEIIFVMGQQIMKVFLPLSAELDQNQDQKRLQELFLTGMRLNGLLALLLGSIFIVFAEQLLQLWLGTRVEQAAELVLILSIATMFATLQQPAVETLRGISRHHDLAWISLGAGISNLVLSLILVFPFGAIGVAIGTLVPAVLEFLTIQRLALRRFGLTTLQLLKEGLTPPLLAAVIPISILFITRQAELINGFLSLFLICAAAAASYLLIYLFTVAGKLEREMVGLKPRVDPKTVNTPNPS